MKRSPFMAKSSLVKEDILGNQIRRHNFVMYAVGQSFTDYNRLANSNFLLELAYWLEQLPEESGIEVNVGDEVKQAKFLKATTANVSYHTTYCNALNMWIVGCESAEEVQQIFYGADVPEQYQSEVLKAYLVKIAAMAGDDVKDAQTA